jgi:hypothetical protein
MIITLEGLAKKSIKSTTEVSISDHTLDWKSVPRSDYGFELTGSGTRNLVIKNLWGTVNSPAIIDAKVLIKYAGTANIIKFVNCKYFKILMNGAEIYGSGNNQSQPLFFEGTCKGIHVAGGYINQGRNQVKGTTSGGACVQIASAESSSLNANNHNAEYVIFEGMVLENTCDEGFYLFKYTGTGTYKPSGSEYAAIRNCTVSNSGRDPFQGRGIKRFEITDNRAKNWGLEQESNHISAISWNAENPSGLISGNHFENGPQFIFAGTEGMYTKVDIHGNYYDAGVHAGPYANSACYLKGPGVYSFKNNVIIAPNALKGVVSVDQAQVQWDISNKFVGRKPFVIYTGGSVVENPVVLRETLTIETLTETTSAGAGPIKYLLPSGQELVPKQP